MLYIKLLFGVTYEKDDNNEVLTFHEIFYLYSSIHQWAYEINFYCVCILVEIYINVG